LPEAHGEAPTIGSILLASLLLKLGAYGLYRFFYFINTFNYFFEDFFFFVYFLAIFSMVSSTLAIFVQLDFKKAIAYFSISHMSYVVIGFITGLYEGILGSYIITLSHGLSSALLFFLVGFLYDQTHTRSIFFYSQLASKIPRFSFFFFFICLANISFPGSAGFVGEQLIFFALSFYGFEFLLFPILFTIFSGFATILFLLKLLYGTKLNNFALKDLKGREYFFSVYCLFPIFFFGFFPFFFI
jgi:NADH-quinone oxidoreductase subunit M